MPGLGNCLNTRCKRFRPPDWADGVSNNIANVNTPDTRVTRVLMAESPSVGARSRVGTGVEVVRHRRRCATRSSSVVSGRDFSEAGSDMDAANRFRN